MALKVPVIPRISEAGQLQAWESELQARWLQLQARRRSAEQLQEKQILLEASLRELNAENVAAAVVLEERRRALSARQARLRQDELAHRQQAAEASVEADKKQQVAEEDTRGIDAAWRELERRTKQADAAHAEEMRALQWAKERALERESEARARLDSVRERETHVLTRLDALTHQRQHSTELLRQTLSQLQRELDERQDLLSRNDETST